MKIFSNIRRAFRRWLDRRNLKANEMICPDCGKTVNVLTHWSLCPHPTVKEHLQNNSDCRKDLSVKNYCDTWKN